MIPSQSRAVIGRTEVERAPLGVDTTAAEPLVQFKEWIAQAAAADAIGVNNMVLATVDASMRPSARVVLCSGVDERGIVWYTNYESRKAVELAANPWAAVVFHWPELERMIRAEGRVERTTPQESDAYYGMRPLDMRIGAWASPQSRVVASTGVIAAEAAKYAAMFLLNPPRPPHWGGFRLVPHQWQFWQARKTKLHDRVRYTLEAGRWQRERLAP